MKITPYYKWPKFSRLKVGDKVKFICLSSYIEFYKLWDGKFVTINSIGSNYLCIDELETDCFHYSYFEIEYDIMNLINKLLIG